MKIGNREITPRQMKIIGAFAAAALLSTQSLYTIDSTENGVLTTFGNISGIQGPGLNFKIPLVQGITPYSLQTQNIEITQKRASCQAAGDKTEKDLGNTTYTKDQQYIYASTSAQYTLPTGDDLKLIHAKYQNYDVLAHNYLNLGMKEVLGSYNTVDIPSKRGEISQQIEDAFKTQVQAEGLPIKIGQVQFGNFDFSCEYEQNVENAAKKKTDQTRTETEREIEKITKEKTIIAAEAEKAKATLEGDGEAYKILAKARAEAEGVRLLQEAISRSPLVIEYKKADRWNGQLPMNIYGAGPVPFLDVTAQNARPPFQATQAGPPASQPNP
jgi:regulator of protease activity HflC (stomatin/prohibitin superfamily)